jgi:Eukaryotic rRNA processing protein EBP2
MCRCFPWLLCTAVGAVATAQRCGVCVSGHVIDTVMVVSRAHRDQQMGFWLQALGAARVAIAKMEAAGTPWRRPPDYYAEMVKTDDHMLKVREQLAFEQKQIEEAGQR